MVKHLLFLFSLFYFHTASSQVSIAPGNTAPHTSAMLDVSSTNRGLLMPRMTSANRTSIAAPARGLMVFDSTTSSVWYFDGTWRELSSVGTSDNNLALQRNTLSSINMTSSTDDQYISDSSGLIYDSGGPAGDYSNNENFTINILFPYGSQFCRVQVISLATEANDDVLRIYGAGGGGAITTFTGNVSDQMLLFNNTEGSIVVQFQSNGSTTAAGFQLRFDHYFLPADGTNLTAANTGFYYLPERGAVRGGFQTANNWHPDSTGFQSFSYGYGTKAKGQYSFSGGYDAKAIGDYSIALGYANNANGNYATALGYGTMATGTSSTALGAGTTASGYGAVAIANSAASAGAYASSLGWYANATNTYATAIGNATTASGPYATAIGYYSTAQGQYALGMGHSSFAGGHYAMAIGNTAYATGDSSFAIGNAITATGNKSMALGNAVSTDGYNGAFVLGDASTNTPMLATAANSFRSRFAGGYRLMTNAAANVGVVLPPGGNSWSAVSDSRLKENFLPVNGESILKKIAQMRQYTWNYKSQDKTSRHYGPMAQEFYAAFGKDDLGTIGSDTLINQQDFLGINLIAVQALEKRTTELQKENEALKETNKRLEARLEKLEKLLMSNSQK